MEEAVPAANKATVYEHLSARRVKLPKVDSSGRRNPNEAIVEIQVIVYGALPRGPPLAVVSELLNVVAYLFYSENSVRRLRYGHGD